MKPTYATVEQIQAATDSRTTAYETTRLRDLLNSASRTIEQRLHRHFYPDTGDRSYYLSGGGAGFWLEADLLSLTSATSDGDAVTIADVTLSSHTGDAPYNWIEISGQTIVVTGVWGYSQDTTPAGALEAAISDTTGTSVDVTNSSLIGIGDLITIDSERMVVTDKTQLDTAQNIGGNLTADKADVSVSVTDGTAYAAGEVILVNSERMLIVDIASNTLTVRRAFDGSVLAAHSSGDDIYAPRTLTVERGAAGTTAATHTDTTAITRNVPPGPITDLCIAEVVTAYAQQSAGYARVIGSGDNQQEAKGAALGDIRKEANRYKRYRIAAV